jgi:predicted MarR family transcription regulator
MSRNSFYPSDEMLLIMKHLEKRRSIREISHELRRNSPHWVHLQLRELEKNGLVANVRPGKALGWMNTIKGRKILIDEGLLKETK